MTYCQQTANNNLISMKLFINLYNPIASIYKYFFLDKYTYKNIVLYVITQSHINELDFFFFREFQFMESALDNSSLSSNQDTN